MAGEPVWLDILWVRGSSLIPWPNPFPHQMPTQAKAIFSERSAQWLGARVAERLASIAARMDYKSC